MKDFLTHPLLSLILEYKLKLINYMKLPIAKLKK